MTGIVIFTAGRSDAFDDYKKTVRNGVPLTDIRPFLSTEDIDLLEDRYTDGQAQVWGTQIHSQWQKVEQGDIALIYRQHELIARATVVLSTENLDLADQLWRSGSEHDSWDAEKPWKYLVFVDQVEEIEVDIEEFNALVGYDSGYWPQGFMRVADHRLDRIERDAGSVENALAELTGTGKRIHPVEGNYENLGDELVAASQDGDRNEELEQLVAKAFTKLGCEAQWIEGGGDTDVEITSPIHAIVEVKARSGSQGIVNLNASRIAAHRDQRTAEYALVVGRHFPPSTVDDAERNDIAVVPAEYLAKLLERRERFGVSPEVIFDHLLDPGQFQDDRLDLLDETIDERLRAVDTLFDVLKGLERSDGPIKAEQIRWILTGMNERGATVLPTNADIAHTLRFLSHPSLGLLDESEDGYQLRTSYDNAITILSSFNNLVQEAVNNEE